MKKSFKKALSLTLATSMAFALPISVSADDELAKVTLPSSGLLYAFDFADGSLANKGTVGGTAAIVGGGSITDGYFDNASTAELATKRVNYMSLPNAKAVAKDINTSANKGLTFSTKIKLVAGKYSEWSPIFVMDSTSNPASWPVFAAELRGTAAWNSAGWFNGDNTKNADVLGGLSTEKWATLTIVANGNEGETGKIYTYVDGTLMNSTDIQAFSTDDNSILGILSAGSDTFFQGVDTAMLGAGQPYDWNDPDAQVLYDDVLLYDSALSAEQVALLSETGVVNTAVAALSTEEDPTPKPAETETTTKAAETKTTTKAAETKTTTKAAETETTTAAASTVEVKVAGNASVKSDVVTVAVKKKVKLDVTVEPSQKVTYTTSNKKVATVTSEGLVKGLKKGKAVITVATADGRTTVAYTVNVVKKAVKNKVLKVAKKTLKVKAGETAQITLKKTTKNTTDKVTYKTNAKKVATVDKYGLVTAKKKGTAKITVKCGSKSVKVTVKVTK